MKKNIYFLLIVCSFLPFSIVATQESLLDILADCCASASQNISSKETSDISDNDYLDEETNSDSDDLSYCDSKGRFLCAECTTSYANSIHLKVHREYEHLICLTCGQHCKTIDKLLSHNKTKHNRKVPYFKFCTFKSCSYVAKSTNSIHRKLSFKKHLKMVHGR